MTERGVSYDLLLAAGVCGIIAFLILRRFLSTPLAGVVALLKTAIPFLYFAYFFDGTWVIIDDMMYLGTATSIVTNGYNPFTVLQDDTGRALLMGVANGPVLLYWWWNVLAVWLFGVHYYSPVFLNIIIVVTLGLFVYRISLHAGFSRGYSQALGAFTVLHWDLLAWSSVLNLKDPMVALLTAAAIYYLVQLSAPATRGRFWPLSKLLLTLVLLSMVRFYATILILGAHGLWLLWRRRRIANYVPWIVAGIVVLLLVKRYFAALSWFNLNVVDILYGIVHFLLTPKPWAIAPNYSFILIPAILHWLLILPALIGGYLAWRRSAELRLLVIYLAVVTIFYAAVPELQGPRQRVQVSFILAWMQFHFFYLILTPVSAENVEKRVGTSRLVPRHAGE